MRYLYLAIRFIQIFLAACLIAVLLVVLFSQIEQRLFRRRAERLLSTIQSLELRKTRWHEAKVRLQPWLADGGYDEPCDEHRCVLRIALKDHVYGQLTHPSGSPFIRLDDYLRWRFKLSYNIGPFAQVQQALLPIYLRLGGRPAQVRAVVGMHEGAVWTKDFFVSVESYEKDSAFWKGEYSLAGESRTASQLSDVVWYGIPRQLRLHPKYLIGRPGGCEFCVFGWVALTPYTDPADMTRLLRFNLSCLTRWRPCRTEGDLMPEAWSQYTLEQSSFNGEESALECSPALLQILGRDSGSVLFAEVVGEERHENGSSYPEIRTVVRLFDGWKGPSGWPVGTTRSIRIHPAPACAAAEVKTGDRLLFLGSWEYPGSSPSKVPLYSALRPLSATDETYLHQGIEQDFDSH